MPLTTTKRQRGIVAPQPKGKKARVERFTEEDSEGSDMPSQLSDLTLSDAHSQSPPASVSSTRDAAMGVAAVSESDAQITWQSTAPFNPEAKQMFKAALPIFRKGDIQQYDAVQERNDDELLAMTFNEWLHYFLRLPAFAMRRKALFTDQQYIDLLHQCMPDAASVAVQMKGRTAKEEAWLYGQLNTCTYKTVSMSWKVAEDRIDVGPVLVTFKEAVNGKGECFNRRPSALRTPLVLGNMRRCIPFSQVGAAIELCHRGPLGVGHIGQDATWYSCLRMFDGITREIVRAYIRRCAVCQTKQPKQHRAALVPLSSKALWERVEMDLLDYNNRPSNGFHYIWHAQDHFSKFHFAAPIVSKSAAEVVKCLKTMLMFTGPVQTLQCDNGGEFMAGVYTLCEQWGMSPPTTSSAYHPQTNGLVERGGGVIKRAIAKWEEQEMSNDWSEVLHRLVYQLNCTAPRTTRRAPYELVFGLKPRWDSVPIRAALDETTLLSVMADGDVEASATISRTAADSESAAALLAGLQLVDASGRVARQLVPTSREQLYVLRTPVAESRTPVAESRTLRADPRTPPTESRTRNAESNSITATASVHAPGVDRFAEACDDGVPGSPLGDAVETGGDAVETGGDADDGASGDANGDTDGGEADSDSGQSDGQECIEQPVLDEFALGAYCRDDQLKDLPRGRLGPISKSIAAELDAGPGRWSRRGTCGAGRCCLSACLQALFTGTERGSGSVDGFVPWAERTLQQQFAACDDLRASVKQWMAGLQGVARRRVEEIVFNVGNSGVDGRGGVSVQLPANASQSDLQRHRQARREQAWSTLMAHLSANDEELGWEFIAALSEFKEINFLVFTHLHHREEFAADTKQAQDQWRTARRGHRADAEAVRQGKGKPGGSWVRETHALNVLVVPRRVREAWPFKHFIQ